MRPLSWPARMVFSFSLLLVPPLAGASHAARDQAYPGMLNYIEGQAAIGFQPLDPKSAGSAELKPGQTLSTEKGKAEILLTPGVFLRLDENSAVTMISPDLTDIEVRLEQGRATLEVAELHPQNELRVDLGSVNAQILKTGYYEFDAGGGKISVYSGKAVVQDSDERVKLKGGRMLDLDSGGPLKASKFNKKQFDEEELNRWSSLRSAYLAEANQDAAGDYESYPSWSDGWYWDPWFDCFTFIPGNGIFYSPFGWGFYSPWWAYGAPFYNYGHYYRHFDGNFRNWGAGPHYGYGRPWSRPGENGGWGGTRGFARSQGGFRAGQSGHFGGGGFHGGGGGSRGGGGHGGGGRP